MIRHHIFIRSRSHPDEFYPMAKTERQTTILCQRQVLQATAIAKT